MQLSVPTLPVTPAASRPANSGRASDRPSSADTDRSDTDADFGSMLAAEPSSRATGKATPKSASKSSNASPASDPESSADAADAKPDQTDPTAIETWLAANGLVPIAAAVEPTPVPLDLLGVSPSATEPTAIEATASDAGATMSAVSSMTVAAEGEGTAPVPTQPVVTDARAGRAVFEIGAEQTTSATPPAGGPATIATATPAAALQASAAVPSVQPQAPAAPATGAGTAAAEVAAATAPSAALEVAVSRPPETKTPPANREPVAADPTASPAARSEAFGGAKGQTPDQNGNSDRQSDDSENFAAVAERVSRRYSGAEKGDLKKSLATEDEPVKTTSSSLGINAAKSVNSMPASASIPSPDLAVRATAAPAPMTFDTLVRETAQVASDVAQAAHRAVDSTMAIAEHFGTGGERSVNLQFSVSGVDLAVRVELRGNAVHTTFRTDSPELRAALAAEWQTVNASQAGNRSQWLADPVFAGSSSGNSLSSDGGSAYQRNPDGRSNPAFAEDFARLRAGADLPSAAEPAPTTPSPFLRPSFIGAGRLHAFA